MVQWATSEETQDKEKCSPFQTLSEQGKQHCSEPSVVCLGDTEDIQKEESCNNQDVKEQSQRDKSLCGICRQKMTDGTNATEFKVSCAYQIGDMGFHGQKAIKCNTKVFTLANTHQTTR